MKINIYEFKIINSETKKIDLSFESDNPLQVIRLAEDALLTLRTEYEDKIAKVVKWQTTMLL